MSKKSGTKVLSFAIACLMILEAVLFVAAASVASPYYNNVTTVTSTADISSSGVITITNKYSASSSVFTKAIITTYIEKRTLGLFWKKIDIGQTDDEWNEVIHSNVYAGTHSAQLPSTGTYRITVEYVIYGSGGPADTITKEIKKTY